MTKTKWRSKLLSLSIVFALVFSLVAMVVPVNTAEAQDPGDLSVDVSTVKSTYCCDDTFIVTATISNGGSSNVTGVNATLIITGNAVITIGDTSTVVGNVTAVGTQVVTWTVQCTGKDTVVQTRFTVVVESNELDDVSGYAEVLQDSGWLEATILSPEQDDVFPVSSVFNVTFYVENTGCNNVTSVWAEVATIAGAEIWPSGLSQTTVYIGDIEAGERSENKTVEVHCTGVGQAILHVDPLGLDACSSKEIEGDSAVVEITQVFGVTCNVTPNPTKVGYNTSFTAIVGTDATLPLSYNMTFGDGNSASATGYWSYTITEYHSYTASGNYTVTCVVTDNSTQPITVNCSSTIAVVYDELGVTAIFRPGSVAYNQTHYWAKTDTVVCFNATREGGFTPGITCYDGNLVAYTWAWDFGDAFNSTSALQNPCFTYNATGNYTATVTLTDDCLGNTDTANVTIEIFEELGVSCSISTNETKVGHEVTFNATKSGGIPTPPANYQWLWEFGDGVTATTQNAVHTYNAGGNYTPTVTVWDDTALNNTATCNKTLKVWPALNVTCDVTPTAQTICEDVFFSATRVDGVPGNAYNWTWTFSDGTTATGQNVTKQFLCVGNWTGTVTITDMVLENTENCTTEEVIVTIVPPVLLAPELNETVLSRWVTFNWTDIGCVNYTLEVWQKDGSQEKVLRVDTGLDTSWTGWIMDGDAYRWMVTAKDACNNTASTNSSFFTLQDTYLSVSVDAPMTGDSFTGDSTTTIIWSTTRNDSFAGFNGIGDGDIEVALSYSTNSGTDWTSIATGQDATGSRAWTTPAATNSVNCLVKAVATDGYGNEGVGISGLFSISTAPAAVSSIELAAGWNLISLPLIPGDTAIATVLAGSSANISLVYYFDPATTWMTWSSVGGGTLTTMEDGKGYWVYTNIAGILPFTGTEVGAGSPPPTPPTYDVVTGWNMIGLKSTTPVAHGGYLLNVAGDYSVLYGFDTGANSWDSVYPLGDNGGMMEPGKGYWIFMTSNGTIIS